MTREEKQKAIDALKISAPVMVVTQEEFNDYIQTLNKVMDWLEQESTIRNCFGCKYSKDNHNSGTEVCHLCMWENQYTPTIKNDVVPRKVVERIIKSPRTQEQMLSMLNSIQSVTPQEPRWIPVSERLPEAGEYIGDVAKYYLVQNEYGDMLVARYTHGEYWEQIYQLKPIGDEIVAWMSLPELYKAESEDT